jgi:hypothetical protein
MKKHVLRLGVGVSIFTCFGLGMVNETARAVGLCLAGLWVAYLLGTFITVVLLDMVD